MSRIIHIPGYSDLEALSALRLSENVFDVPCRSILRTKRVEFDFRHRNIIVTYEQAIRILSEIDRLVCCLNRNVGPIGLTYDVRVWEHLPNLLSGSARGYFESLYRALPKEHRVPMIMGSYRYTDDSTDDMLYLVSVKGGQLGVIRVGPHKIPTIQAGWAESVALFTGCDAST
ncbi:MAG TPA: hypothetical protein VN420_03170 [Candidatus Fimivivens sp.]|nr:hypothetical protein [Candidatus Fimivivens sp.]